MNMKNVEILVQHKELDFGGMINRDNVIIRHTWSRETIAVNLDYITVINIQGGHYKYKMCDGTVYTSDYDWFCEDVIDEQPYLELGKVSGKTLGCATMKAIKVATILDKDVCFSFRSEEILVNKFSDKDVVNYLYSTAIQNNEKFIDGRMNIS